MGKESSMAYDRAGQLQSIEEPHNSYGTRRRAALVYTYFENVGTELTRRPLFTNNKLRWKWQGSSLL